MHYPFASLDLHTFAMHDLERRRADAARHATLAEARAAIRAAAVAARATAAAQPCTERTPRATACCGPSGCASAAAAG
jgi:hypothetical protein